MSYRCTTIANYLITKSRSCGGITPLKLIKMVYLSHGWNLAFRDRPLIKEDIEAWKYGPVIRDLYKVVGGSSQPITNLIECITEQISPDDIELIDAVFDRYNHMDGIQLSQLTHSKGSPWKAVWDKYGQSVVIPQTLIRDYFKQKLNENNSRRSPS